MTFSSVATALMLGFCCKTASSKGCSWWGKEEKAYGGAWVAAPWSSKHPAQHPPPPRTGVNSFLEEPRVRKPFLVARCLWRPGKPSQGLSGLLDWERGPPILASPWSLTPLPGSLVHLPRGLPAPLTSTLSRAETQASEASQMAVKSWPPSRASTTRPPASVISCLVKWPKPLGMSEGRKTKWF